MIHELKIQPSWFTALRNGKNFEVRRFDRNFCKGDRIVMREWDEEYLGHRATAEITYVLTFSDFHDAIKPGWCIIGLDNIVLEDEEDA